MSKEKLLSNIVVSESGCWIWQKSVTSAGYGNIMVDKKYWSTHKYSYFIHKGEIEEGMVIRHLCHNTRCCNPDHLEVGTHKQNWNDSKNNHKIASDKKRHKWIVDGIHYDTCSDVVNKTGLSISSVIKYTDENGIFDIASYRNACAIARCIPKV